MVVKRMIKKLWRKMGLEKHDFKKVARSMHGNSYICEKCGRSLYVPLWVEPEYAKKKLRGCGKRMTIRKLTDTVREDFAKALVDTYWKEKDK
ncbi:hypothetical protein 035JT001_86 [Bacillus phage 035JT001]|nr:hypothetical protein 035JT001_86 [Bacillus phage 035JT001]